MSADLKAHINSHPGFGIKLEKVTVTEESSTPMNTGRFAKSKLAKPESRFYSIYQKIVESGTIHKEYLTPHFVNKMLEKPDKNDRDAIILYEYFKNYPFFLQFFDENQDIEEKDAFLYLLKHSNLVVGDVGDTIYTEGVLADGNIFIVLKGKVCMIERGTGAGGLNEDLLHLADEEKAHQAESSNPNSPKKKTQVIGPSMAKLLTRGISKRNIRDSPFSPSNPQIPLGSLNLAIPTNSQKDNSPNIAKSPSKGMQRSPTSFGKLAQKEMKISKEASSSNLGFKVNSPAKSRIAALFRWAQLIANTDKEKSFSEDPTVPVLKKSTFFESVTKEDFENSNTILKYMVEPEGYFGHNITYDGKRKETAILMEYSELMILRRDHFNAIFQKFSKKKIRKLTFMIDYIPNIEVIHNNQILENLSTILTEKRFRCGEYVCHEGNSSEYFYMLAEGRCDVLKTLVLNVPARGGALDKSEKLFRAKAKNKEEMRLNILEKGSFFAEEIIVRKDKMIEYTVKVTSSQAIIYAIHRRRFLMRFPKAITDHVTKMLLKKREEKRTMLDSTLKFKKIDFNPSELYVGGPIVKDARFRKDHHLIHKSSSVPKINRIEEDNSQTLDSIIMQSPSLTPSLIVNDGQKVKVSQFAHRAHRKSFGGSSIEDITKISSQGGFVNGSERNSAILQELDYDDASNMILASLFSPEGSPQNKRTGNKSVQPQHQKPPQNEVKAKFGHSRFLVEYSNYLNVMRNKFESVDEVLKNLSSNNMVEEPKTINMLELQGEEFQKRLRLLKGIKPTQMQSVKNIDESLLSHSILKSYNDVLTRTKSREGKTFIDRFPLSPADAMLPNLPLNITPDVFSRTRYKPWAKKTLKPMLLREGFQKDSEDSSSSESPRDLPGSPKSKSNKLDGLQIQGGMKTLTQFEFRRSKKNGFLAKRVGGFATKPLNKDNVMHKRNLTMPFITSPEIMQDMKI